MNRNIIIQVEFGLIMKFKKFPFSITKADLLLFLLLAATGIVPFLLQTAHGSEEQGTLIAVVTVDGETYGIYPLEVKIESVRCVIVRGDCLRVVIDHNHVVAHLTKCPDAVYRAVVKLDSLSDPDRA